MHTNTFATHNTQVREAYTKRGWSLTLAAGVEQCKDDHYQELINEQKGEGCRMYGHLQVNKVVSGREGAHRLA